MSKNSREEQIKSAICEYANAYAKLEDLQKADNPLIPRCDQKTGAIGEFYAMQYAKYKFPSALSIKFSSPSQHAWDICILDKNGKETKIQVKTVSGFSETSTMSPLHSGWDELWLLRLNKSFTPEGFWCVKDKSIVGKEKTLTGKKMPKVGFPRRGSRVFSSKTDLTEELEKLISMA